MWCHATVMSRRCFCCQYLHISYKMTIITLAKKSSNVTYLEMCIPALYRQHWHLVESNHCHTMDATHLEKKDDFHTSPPAGICYCSHHSLQSNYLQYMAYCHLQSITFTYTCTCTYYQHTRRVVVYTRLSYFCTHYLGK